jgi:hypothetical protein
MRTCWSLDHDDGNDSEFYLQPNFNFSDRHSVANSVATVVSILPSDGCHEYVAELESELESELEFVGSEFGVLWSVVRGAVAPATAVE